MRSLSKKHRRIAAVAGVVVLSLVLATAWELAAPLRGDLAARWDIRHGRYRELTYGLPALGYPDYARRLQERYGIDVHPAAFCIVSGPLKAYVDSYDQVSMAAAKRKFGHEVFEETWREVEDQIGPGVHYR